MLEKVPASWQLGEEYNDYQDRAEGICSHCIGGCSDVYMTFVYDTESTCASDEHYETTVHCMGHFGNFNRLFTNVDRFTFQEDVIPGGTVVQFSIPDIAHIIQVISMRNLLRYVEIQKQHVIEINNKSSSTFAKFIRLIEWLPIRTKGPMKAEVNSLPSRDR